MVGTRLPPSEGCHGTSGPKALLGIHGVFRITCLCKPHAPGLRMFQPSSCLGLWKALPSGGAGADFSARIADFGRRSPALSESFLRVNPTRKGPKRADPSQQVYLFVEKQLLQLSFLCPT